VVKILYFIMYTKLGFSLRRLWTIVYIKCAFTWLVHWK